MSDYFLNKIYDSLLSNKPVPKKPEPIVEKKETFKPLSKVYEVLVREAVDHRAIYGSEELVDPNEIPQKPGLQTLGAVSDKMYREISQRVRSEASSLDASISTLFKLAKLPKKYHNFVKETMINSGLEKPEEFLQLLIQKKEQGSGLFEVKEGTFNSIALALQNINEAFTNEKKSLQTFLTSLFQTVPVQRGAAVGPGELFFSMISNAQVAVGQKENETTNKKQKSGDLYVPNLGVVEAKATTPSGALLGGDGAANESLNIIPKKLQEIDKNYQRRTSFELKKLQQIQNILNTTKTDNPEKEFYTLKQKIEDIIDKSQLDIDLKKFDSIIRQTSPKQPSLLTQLSTGNKWVVWKNKQGISFLEKYKKLIQERINKTKNYEQEQKLDTTDLAVLLADSISILKRKENILPSENIYKTLIDILVLIRSERPINPEKELKVIFPTLESIYKATETFEQCSRLVGAIHLYCYTKIHPSNYYLFVNVANGSESKDNSYVVKSPTSLQEAIAIAYNKDISFVTQIDAYEAGTKIAESVKIRYNP